MANQGKENSVKPLPTQDIIQTDSDPKDNENQKEKTNMEAEVLDSDSDTEVWFLTENDLPLDEPIDEQEQLKNRREQYKCGDKFITLSNVETWQSKLDKRSVVLDSAQAKFQPNNEFNKKVSLWLGDITALEIDTIVNAAKPSLLGGGGIDGAIHKAAGPGLVNECMFLGGCEIGESKITKGYKLPAKHVIHTVGPIGEDQNALAACYNSCLNLMIKNQLKTIAFCCISTGIYGYPNKAAAHVALSTVRSWMESNSSKIDRIIFCIFLKKDYTLYSNLMQRYYFPWVPENPDFK